MTYNFRLSEDAATTVIDFDPDASDTLTNPGQTTWVDMSKYHHCTAYYFPTAAGGKIQQFNIQVSASSDGSSPTTVVSNGSSTPTALTGYAILECTHDDIAAALEGGRYVGCQLSLSTGTDEGRLVIITHGARYGAANLSADSQ